MSNYFSTLLKECVALLLPCISYGLNLKFVFNELIQLIKPLENHSPFKKKKGKKVFLCDFYPEADLARGLKSTCIGIRQTEWKRGARRGVKGGE